MQDHLEERLETVERALTDGETDLGAVAAGAATGERVETLEARLDALEDEVSELDAALQAVRGYVGEIRAVNSEVEETAAAAMATAERATAAGSDPDGRGQGSTPADGGSASPASPADRSPGTDNPAPSRSGRGHEAPRVRAGASDDASPACPTCGRHGREGPSTRQGEVRAGEGGWPGDDLHPHRDERGVRREPGEWPPGDAGGAAEGEETGGRFGRLRSLL